jgi:hypothetical protein
LFAAGKGASRGQALACLDGHIWTEADITDAERARCITQPKIAAARSIAQAVPVMRVDELLEDSDFLADVLSAARDANGAFWPVLKVPYRLAKTPARVRAVPGAPEIVRRAPPAPARAPVPEDRPA